MSRPIRAITATVAALLLATACNSTANSGNNSAGGQGVRSEV